MLTLDLRWRRAITLSCLLHLLLLTAFGCLLTGLLNPPPVIEQLLELDLTSEAAAPGAGIPPAEPEPVSPLRPVAAISQPVPPESQAVASIDDPAAVTAAIPAFIAKPTANAQASAPAGTATAGNTAGSATSGGITPPRILSMTDPHYPETARQAGIEGTVMLKIQILEDGRPGSIAISRSSGHEALDEAAVTAVRQWLFVPAKNRDSGYAIQCYIIKPISFRLTK